MHRICSIEGCGKKHSGKGYCHKHYQNFLRSGNPLGEFNGNKKARYEIIGKGPRKGFICKVKDCNKKYWRKDC